MAKCKINQRRKKGKCVPRKGVFKFFNRRTKNPFRMLGSYLGGIIVLTLFWITGLFFLTAILACGLESGGGLLGGILCNVVGQIITLFILPFFVGFFIGYAIQLIIRLFRK